MPRHVKARHTKAIFVRKPKAKDAAEKEERQVEDLAKQGRASHQHVLPKIPSKLQRVLRKPVNAYYTSKKLRRQNRRHQRELLRAIDLRLDHHAKSFGGVKIHPIAVLAWLSAEEPFDVDFLLENSTYLLDEPLEGYLEDSLDDEEDTYKGIDPILIEQLDRLLEKFATSAIDNASSFEDNQLLKVPKDYSMIQMPHAVEGVEDYDVLMDGIEKVAESQEQAERTWSFRDSTPKPTSMQKEKEQVGFDPVQVLKKHAIQFQNTDAPNLSTLDNEIHPIFRAENFHGCPAAIYAALAPGMRLASLLLTHRSTSSFWHTLKFGRRDTTFRNQTLWPHITEVVSWTASNDRKWNAYLEDVSEQIHITFALWPTEKHQGFWTYGTMHPIRDYKRGYLPPSPESEGNFSQSHRKSSSVDLNSKAINTNGKSSHGYRMGRINLHMDFYTTAKRLSLLRSPDPAMVLRFNLFLAINLCHEFAHYVEMCDPTRVRFAEPFMSYEGESSGEAYFLNYKWQEMGASFETSVFGGNVQPVSCRTDCMYGLCTFDYTGEQKHGHGPRGPLKLDIKTFWTVPMDFAAKVQQKSEWEKHEDGKWLKIPRDGATAVRVPYFDMTMWKDEAEDPISDDVDGRLTPFKRTKDGRIEKRVKSPPKVDPKKVEQALRSKSPLVRQANGEDDDDD